MKCKSCSGPLVMRETQDYPIDENGVYFTGPQVGECEVVCSECGARHDYDTLNQGGGFHTIALAVNSDPKPVVEVAIDEDRHELGQYLAARAPEWMERVGKLVALIPKGEWKASFKEKEDGDEPS